MDRSFSLFRFWSGRVINAHSVDFVFRVLLCSATTKIAESPANTKANSNSTDPSSYPTNRCSGSEAEGSSNHNTNRCSTDRHCRSFTLCALLQVLHGFLNLLFCIGDTLVQLFKVFSLMLKGRIVLRVWHTNEGTGAIYMDKLVYVFVDFMKISKVLV
eukprot:c13281_g1_i3.p1 GENE.c13281_g1_i3~~c13281_g1_i3.p1  ORF type:complete len:158 (-),score=21.22 c13281_g1_i3:132-605(-)